MHCCYEKFLDRLLGIIQHVCGTTIFTMAVAFYDLSGALYLQRLVQVVHQFHRVQGPHHRPAATRRARV